MVRSRILGAALLFALICASPLPARATVQYEINIGAQPLASSLAMLAKQTGIQVVYSTDLVEGCVAPSLKGAMTTEQALTTMLARTHLKYAFLDAQTVTITPMGSSPQPQDPGAKEGRAGASRIFRVAQLAQAPADSLADAPAQAAQPSETNQLQEVTVSASLIHISGYEAPTPVTSVGIAQLQDAAKPDLGDVLRQLPAFGGSSSPQNSVESSFVSNLLQGENFISLRNLGPNRTLVLVDGQRYVQNNIQGGVDLTNIPTALIERIDVVTGGASAQWGSDAVAGVVNLILNKTFSGIQFDVEQSNNWQHDHEQYRAALTIGTDFDDHRGHVIVSGSYWDVPEPFFSEQTQGFAYQRLVTNPACQPSGVCPPGQPLEIHASNVGLATEAPGGIITGGLNGAPSPFTNTYFVGQGTPLHFNPGNVSLDFFSNGGTSNVQEGDYNENGVPIASYTAFGLGTFKITDRVKATLQLNYSNSDMENNSYTFDQYGTVPIYSGNPFIPPSIQAQMTAQGIPGFMMGTSNVNNLTGNGGSLAAEVNSVGIPVLDTHRRIYRGLFSLEGQLGSKWTWSAFYEHGEAWTYAHFLNNVQTQNMINAENAVTVTPANVGHTGLPIGSIACLSNVLAPGQIGPNGETYDPNCAPLNLFGVGVASQAAMDYVNGAARSGQDWTHVDLAEDISAASMQGELPVGLPAGPVAAAFGVQYRREKGTILSAPLEQQAAFELGTFAQFFGEYDVKEAFAEFNVPLLKDTGVKSLNFDAAYRATEYSTSGFVSTYKFGILSQLTDDLRFRASYSYDIRAPNLFELYSSPELLVGSAVDPHTGKTVSVEGVTEGNPNLVPEKAETRSFGFVLTPTVLPGFTASADFYYIFIKDAINDGLFFAVIINQCAMGNQQFCKYLVFNGPGGALSDIITEPLNLASLTTSGLDVDGDYRFPFRQGAWDFNLASTYMFEQTYTALGRAFDYANSISYDSPYLGVPKFKATLAATYTQGPWLGTIQTRLIGQAKLSNDWNASYVDNNNVPFISYWDLRGSYKFDNGIQLYAAIDNVLDRYPPVVGFDGNALTGFESPFRDDLYDAYGRVWRIGVRGKF